ncbi:pilus assembly protein [Zhongshania marina]|uniref:Pilus assembly protein n=2 Tax=Zhongshania marina TaxID=2304603 RepID=A0ABX9W207_9GAMM|nr:pilus assembly protein [Zhongshania marina]
MYILDDSGSMQFELMPDSIIYNSARYIFPRADGVYKGNDYSNYVPTVDNNSGFNARSRSPQINSVYYNPGTTYYPWVKADGSLYPNADPTCALHNPDRTTNSYDAKYCRNLKVNNENYNSVRWYSCTSDGSCSSTTGNKTFWPAKYFWYQGTGSDWSWNNFKEVEIRSGKKYTGDGRENRDDCNESDDGSVSCTYDQEIQNFANWYTYYRSRILTARGGSGYAFAEQGAGIRVGFGSINQSETSVDGKDTTVIVNGVRAFDGEARTAFYKSLYEREIPNAGTPLRLAIDAAGKYFSRDDNKGPWGAEPGTDDDSDHLQCRRNYTVLMTDGYWSGGATSGATNNNNDGTDGPSHTGPTGASYTYKKVSPFTDGESGTLADVAMYYWKNDLRTDLANVVAISKKSPAFWQHMTTFGVGLGVFGTVDPDAAFNAISSGDAISWPKPTSSEVHKIDDLLHAAVNSRGGFFSASEPDVFANKLGDILQTIANESKSSASSVAANSTRLDSGTLIYQASFNSLEWSGRIVAYSLNGDGSLNNVVWDTNKGGIPAPGSRNIITGVGEQSTKVTKAVAFTLANWNELTTSQQNNLRAGQAADEGKARLSWLRGDKSNEGSKFRERTVILGDIINSDPFFVGTNENFGFNKLPGLEGSSYAAFLSSKASREAMIYVGANDGMLHGFDAATGVEKFAYIPVSAYPKLAELTESEYEHSYIVDGSPRVLDAYIDNTWKSILVSSTAAGGKSVFAIDVTNPASMNESNLLWEFATESNATDKLGVAMSQPAIARVAAGSNKWVAVFGNGYNSGDTVKLFVVDLKTGALIKAINTGVSGTDNGLATPVPVDVNNDRVTDFVYAGDLKGNLWKFDLSGANTNQWDVAYKTGSVPTPLYKVVDLDGNPQPITSRPTVGVHPSGGYMVYFGTGKYFENSDGLIAVTPPVQDFYGIRDNGASFVGRDKLLSQSIDFEGEATTANGLTSANKIRIVSNNSVGTPPTYGWHLPLYPPSKVRTGERVVSQPVLRNGRIIFATIIPSESVCGFGGSSWLMELDADTGGRIGDPVLDINGDGKVNALDVALYQGDYYPASGIGSPEMIKTPGIIGAGELEYKYTSGTSGTIGVITETGGGSDVSGRQSWRQLQ